jgi:hypothetical protein
MSFDERVNKALLEMEKLNYEPRIFMNMIDKRGMVDAVKRLVNSPKVSSGFTRLWELHRLDLSMENIIQEPEWHDLFTEEERRKARMRLADYEYNV